MNISGTIDLNRIAAEACDLSLPPQGAVGGYLAADGSIDIRWNPAHVTASIVPRGVTFVIGRMRFADRSQEPAANLAAQFAERYWRRGMAAFEDVRGRFAVVHVDRRDRKAVLAADRFAIESLCFSAAAGRIQLADHADAVPGPHVIDPQSLYDYFYFHVIPSPATIYSGVRRLEGGHAVVIDSSRSNDERYWVPRFNAAGRCDVDALAEEFRRIVRESVEREAAGARVGAFLSGGTDSSTVVGYLAGIAAPVQAYSIGFDQAGFDEMRYARIAARHFGAEHHEYYVTPADIADTLPKLAAHYDQPFGNSSTAPAHICAMLAKKDGLDTLLAGDGGDELFGGNVRYARQKLFGYYDSLPRGLRRGVVEPVLLGSTVAGRLPGVRKVRRYVEQARVSMPERMETYNVFEALEPDKALDPQRLLGLDRNHPKTLQSAVYADTRGTSVVDRMLEYDWKFTLVDNDLPKVVGATALAGIQVGFPLLSDELVDFSVQLPPTLKLKGLKLRWFFKYALRDFLPQAILTKSKHGFGLPFGHWAVRDARLRQLVGDSMSALVRRRIVLAQFARDLVDDKLPKHPGYYGEMVWVLTFLEQWFRTHEGRQADRLQVSGVA